MRGGQNEESSNKHKDQTSPCCVHGRDHLFPPTQLVQNLALPQTGSTTRANQASRALFFIHKRTRKIRLEELSRVTCILHSNSWAFLENLFSIKNLDLLLGPLGVG